MTGRAAAFAGGLLAALLLWPCAPASAQTAQPSDDVIREAGKHFQRGVTLYSESDYRGALVEFRRAYETTLNGSVLYNIGETEYQLHDYAGALTTFERYLVEAGPTDSHRAEVESNLRELRTRVGRLTINTIPRGAEVSVDDHLVGNTPFDAPVVIGVGHVRVTATLAGRQPATREVDVAAEDELTVLLQLAPVPSVKTAPVPARVNGDGARTKAGASSLRTMGWVGAGVLGAGAVAMGLLAIHEGDTLKSERDAYQDDMSAGYAADKRSRLDVLSIRTRRYAFAADSLGAAAVVVGAIMVMTSGRGSGEPPASPPAQVGLGLGSMTVSVPF
jgi:tetratricopeptide (TPR) repeat protein